jgi:bifunctional UDP-N-acetylglucosamine pyrophosphorylase/glucosamine-1-phosphate N-acetyltransferase/UDP-N-acetylglucosamine pyrophosphorylase
MSNRLAIVLAAGKGTRMKTDLPKVVVEVCRRPMIHFVLDALEKVGVDTVCVVVGYRSDEVRYALSGRNNLIYVDQVPQLGTGHAVMVCREHLLGRDGPVAILTGDSPLLQPDSLSALFELYEQGRPACILGTQYRDDPTGLGRIVRDAQGGFLGIVEEKDATEQQRAITEVNMSTYVFDCTELVHCLDRIGNHNRQGEYYLTDAPGILRKEGKDVRALPVLKPCEALSINTLEELAVVEAEMKRMGYCQ